jgi:SAM-dependent methyltransferase
MSDDPSLIYRRTIENVTLRSIWMQAYGDRCWLGGEPPWTMATADDIEFALTRLPSGLESSIADIGCGSGCFARFAAKASGTRVVGIDANPAAIGLANALEAEQGGGQMLSFRVGDFAATGWPDASFDGAASFDVLLFVPDKFAALGEVARILRPGSAFVGTTWELQSHSASLSAPQFTDYPAAFERAGFRTETYEEAPGWRGLLERFLAGIVAREDDLRSEMHPLSADRLLAWARSRPLELDDARRVRFAVRRP